MTVARRILSGPGLRKIGKGNKLPAKAGYPVVTCLLGGTHPPAGEEPEKRPRPQREPPR